MTTSTVTPEIAAFAQGVRVALADLPAEEVDDLTDGLEADLAEAYAEDLQRELPDPAAYAAELRAAAGLPVRTKTAKRGLLSGLVQGWHDTRADIAIAVRRNPALASTLDFLGELRPAWWILRGVIAVMCVRYVTGDAGNLLPNDLPDVIVFVVFTLVSVQWGRGRWHLPRGMGPLLFVGNVIAAVIAIPVLTNALDHRDVYHESYASAEQDLTGVYSNGTEVTNIFGFDAKGRPLANVQLFDQDGNPLATAVPGANGCLDSECGENGMWVPSTLRNGTVAWNVYPMKMIKAEMDDDGGFKAVPGAQPEKRPSPYVRVPALVTPEKVAKSND